MAVCANNDVAGAHKTLLGQQGVLHAAVAALVIVGDVLLLGKLARHHHLIGGINIFLRRKVVHAQASRKPLGCSPCRSGRRLARL